jgi:hypothetical protein
MIVGFAPPIPTQLPVPDRVAVCTADTLEPPLEVSETFRLADLGPVARGPNVTLIVQVPPGLSEELHVVADWTKSLRSRPLIVIPEIARSADWAPIVAGVKLTLRVHELCRVVKKLVAARVLLNKADSSF